MATVSLLDQEGNVVERGRDTGASNGYAVTARFSKPGGSYQNVVVVQDGATLAQVEDGSTRRESAGFLWKPQSANDGKLVILTGSAPEEEEGDDVESEEIPVESAPEEGLVFNPVGDAIAEALARGLANGRG